MSAIDSALEALEDCPAVPAEDARPPAARKGDLHAHREKHRLRFRKRGALCFIGHQDLLKAWQRLFRRTALPLRVTEGFHPRPALSSPLALGLGIEGLDEVLEFELTEPVPDAEVERRIAAQLDPGMELASLERLPRRASACAVAVEYRFPVPADRATDVDARLAAALAAATLPIERRMPDKPTKRLDLRPYLESAARADGAVVFRLAVRPQGTARPEEILELLGLRPLLDQGLRLVRTRVELASSPMPDAGAQAPAAPLEGTAS